MKAKIMMMAKESGIELEFKGPWVREINHSKWLKFKQMYRRLYWQLRKRKGKQLAEVLSRTNKADKETG